MNRVQQGWHFALGCAVLAAWSTTARAEIFFLKGQGLVRGELVNRRESPRKFYVIKTASGGQVVLTADQVERVQAQSPAELKYDRFRADIPDTVEGQWKAAQWCQTNRLTKHRALHLARILKLDPNHQAARHALGYSQVAGEWVTQAQAMHDEGYVKSKFAPGRWVSPQEEELLATRDQTNKAQLAWKAKLKRFDGWLSGDKAAQAIAFVEAIKDPLAVPALAEQLATARDRDARLLYVAALGRINVPAALDVLIEASLFDQDEGIRSAALDEVARRDYEPAVLKYVQSLRHEDNTIVNRAGMALQQMGEPIAIGPLIEALVTTHRIKVASRPTKGSGAWFTHGFTADGSGRANSSSNGGTSFSVSDGKPRIVEQKFENRYVLDALVSLSDGTSFNFDVDAWKRWNVASRKAATLDARRDAKP